MPYVEGTHTPVNGSSSTAKAGLIVASAAAVSTGLNWIYNWTRGNRDHGQGYAPAPGYAPAYTPVVAAPGCPATCASMGGCFEASPVSQNESRLEAENAMLKADRSTDNKILELYKYVEGQFSIRDAALSQYKERQNDINCHQTAYNATNTATISCIQTQLQQLQGLTRVTIPENNILPTPVTPVTIETATNALASLVSILGNTNVTATLKTTAAEV